MAYNEWPGYGRIPHKGLLKSVMDSQPAVVKVDKSDLQPGDLLLMRFVKEPQHIAIYAQPTIIHAYEAVGKVCEHDFSDEWQRRVIAVYRFKGLQ
jgi:cell wall-associated NlpC family hydrolase